MINVWRFHICPRYLNCVRQLSSHDNSRGRPFSKKFSVTEEFLKDDNFSSKRKKKYDDYQKSDRSDNFEEQFKPHKKVIKKLANSRKNVQVGDESVSEKLRNFRTTTSNEHSVDIHPLLKDDSSKTKKPLIDPPLLRCLTPEHKEEIIGKGTSRKFKFAFIENQVRHLFRDEYPLPNSLSKEQWNQLLDFDSDKSRLFYFEAIYYGTDKDPEKLKELREIDSEPFKPLTVDPEVLEKIIQNDPTKREQWNKILSAYEETQMDGKLVYPYPNEEELTELFEAKSSGKRIQLLRFFSIKQRFKLKRHIEKMANLAKSEELIEAKKQELKSPVPPYGLGGNSIFLRLNNGTMMNHHKYGEMRQLMSEWGRPLVIDFKHTQHMGKKELKSLIYHEIQYVVQHNRESPQPFCLNFVNVLPEIESMLDSSLVGIISKNIDWPYTVTSQSYMDLFPHDKLVYLSPDSRNELTWSPDDIYIIGGLVDPVTNNKLSISEAKRFKIRHAKFPLRKTVGLEAALNVEHAVAILLDFLRTKDWFYSCRWIPPRMLKNLLKTGPFTVQQEYTYLTHKKLHPHAGFLSENGSLSPEVYRKLYSEYIALAPDVTELQDPSKYRRKIND